MNILDSVVTQAAAISAIRRDIHAHPELGFEECPIAAQVADKLECWDYTLNLPRTASRARACGSSRSARSRHGWRQR